MDERVLYAVACTLLFGVVLAVCRLSTLAVRASSLRGYSFTYATGAALSAKAGMTSAANRRSERSACSWGKVPQAKAQIT